MRAWTLCKKDLRIFVRDRVGLLLGLGLPLVLALVFGGAMGAMGSGDEGMGRVRLFVEDRDGTDESAELLDALADSDGLRIERIELPAQGGDYETAEERVAGGDAAAGLLVPKGYAANLTDGEPLGLVLYRDPGQAIEQQIIAGNLLPALMQSAGQSLGGQLRERMLGLLEFPLVGREQAQEILDRSFEHMDELVARLEEQGTFEDEAEQDGEEDDPGGFDFAEGITDLLGLETKDVVGGGENDAMKIAQQSHAVAGIAVMMLLFGLVACGGTLLEEQAEGTLDRLRLAPGTASDILKGKFLFTWIVGISQLVILFLVTTQVFAIPVFRAPVALLVLSSVVAIAATGFGLLFAVLCRTRKQLEGLSTIMILTMSALGGSWWPLMMTPDWYQFLGHFTINAWAMDAYQALFWYEQGLADILPEIGVLLGIGAGTTILALSLWSRRLRVA